MTETDVLCSVCGSADVLRKPVADDESLTDEEIDAIEAMPVEAHTWVCERDHVFNPHPCPKCGSYEVEGALGVSGMRFERPSVVVVCRSCGEEFPPHPTVAA